MNPKNIRSLADLSRVANQSRHILTLFSGGLDSTYVLRKLAGLDCKVTALSVERRRSRIEWPAIGIPEIMLLMVAAVWGSSYSITKQATDHLAVLDFLALRFGLTFFILLPALRPLFGARWHQGLAVGGLLGGNLLAVFMCETFGVTLTTASNAAFLISLCVGFTPLVEWGLFKRRPSGKILGAVAASVLGAALLMLTSTSTLSVGWGDGLILVAAFLRAVMVCATRRLAGRHALPALTLTAIQSGVMAAGTLLIALVVPLTRWGHAMKAPWDRLAGNGCLWLEISFLVLLYQKP